MAKFSSKELLKQKYGEQEKNQRTAKSTKKVYKKSSTSKLNDGRKYKTKIIDGVKYMVLR